MNAVFLLGEVYIFSFSLLIIILYWSLRNGGFSESSRWFNRALVVFMCGIALDFAWALFYAGVIPDRGHFYARLLKLLYYMAFTVAVYLWCTFAEVEVRGGAISESVFLKICLAGLFLFAFLAAVGGPNSVVWFDANGVCRRGIMVDVMMLCFIAETSWCSFRLIGHAMTETNQSRRSLLHLLACFPFYLTVSWLLMLRFEGIPILCVSVTVSLVSTFIGANAQQISQDKLTQVNNRQNLISYIDGLIRSHDQRIFLLMMDVDYFKQINDTFGHQEGDAALVRVANSLKGACESVRRRPFLSRFGGDEFIIVVQTESEAEVEALCANIRERLSAFQDWAHMDYPLSLSIGCAEWMPGMGHKELIQAADEALYRIKQVNHQDLDRHFSWENAGKAHGMPAAPKERVSH